MTVMLSSPAAIKSVKKVDADMFDIWFFREFCSPFITFVIRGFYLDYFTWSQLRSGAY